MLLVVMNRLWLIFLVVVSIHPGMGFGETWSKGAVRRCELEGRWGHPALYLVRALGSDQRKPDDRLNLTWLWVFNSPHSLLGVGGCVNAGKDLRGKNIQKMPLMSKIKLYLCLKNTKEQFISSYLT